MTALLKPILILLAIAAALGMGSSAVQKWYLAPRSALKDQINRANGVVNDQRAARDDRRRLSNDLQGFVDRTLGPDLETVDHRLLTRLHRLCEQYRLHGGDEHTNARNGGKPRQSPAKMRFRSSAQRWLRDEWDFVELEATISGIGTLEDVVRLINSIEREPWIKRIDEVRLDPRDNGARMNLSLRLTTLFLPGRSPRVEYPSPAVAEADARYLALVSGNPFRVPPPPQPAVAAAPLPAVPLGPPPFPFDQWALTGLAQGPAGAEAWLLHRPSGETRVLAPGQQLDTAVFSGAVGDAAEFTLGDQRFVVTVGATLDQRSQAGP